MFRLFLFSGLVSFIVNQAIYAGSREAELLDQYNQDPSLLLDPSTYLEAPPENREPANASEPTPAPPPMPEAPQLEPEKVAEKVVEEPKPVVMEKPAEEIKPAVSEAPPIEKQPEKVAEALKSELIALPGVSDFSIILSGDKFFPSVIRMKQNGNKNRLLFITAGAKPAALVFVKPRIQRWISSQTEGQSVEEYREVNGSKITEIEFNAEPGNYEYYDALSGARGEIKVE